MLTPGKTLGEIIEAARSGGRPDYDDLRLAVCALDILGVFDRQALMTLAEAENKGQKPMLTRSAVWQNDERFGRMKRALNKAPREYLGADHDPDSPEVQARRQKAKTLVEKVLGVGQCCMRCS